MTSALDRLIAEVLKSSDPQLRALATEVQEECNRAVGRPPKLSADDAGAMFIVFCGVYGRDYTGEVYFVDGEPVAVTEPTIDPTEAIARELMAYARCSINTARDFAREQIARIVANLEAALAARGRRINQTGGTPKERIATLKHLTNNS
jgi:hypothetical protein